MSYKLNLTKQAQSDFDYHKKTGNKSVLNKIAKLLHELTVSPYKEQESQNNLSTIFRDCGREESMENIV